jgi:DNA-directed RNA polymerase beta subunit
VDGRANNGGQKFGEMEFDAQKANGAAYALYDRSVTASDKFRTMICQACGTMGEVITPTLGALSKGSGYTCRACSGSAVAEIDTTYCYSSLLVKELAAMNIRVQHHIPTGRLEMVEDAIMGASQSYYR